MKKIALALVAASLIASPALAQEKKSPGGYDKIKECLVALGLTENVHFRPVTAKINDTQFGADINRAIWQVESFAPKRDGVKFCIGATEKVEQAKQ